MKSDCLTQELEGIRRILNPIKKTYLKLKIYQKIKTYSLNTEENDDSIKSFGQDVMKIQLEKSYSVRHFEANHLEFEEGLQSSNENDNTVNEVD